jgi:hypothetical protein
MATDKQIAANRANAQNSTGPRTESGKSRTRLNARRHGLTGQVHLMTPDDQAAFDHFAAEYIQTLNPANPVERQLAQSIAHDNWRINRMRALEDNLLSIGYAQETEVESTPPERASELEAAVSAARTYAEDPHQILLLSLYIQRTNREIHRNLELLHRMQAERRAQRTAALAEAILLRQSDEQQNYAAFRAEITGEPLSNGFVFSNGALDAFALQHEIQNPPRHNEFTRYIHRERDRLAKAA